MDLLNNLKNFDAYPKTLEDFRVRTYSGAAGKDALFYDTSTRPVSSFVQEL
jgi:hypothetical protein